jgi:hypothetical protein
MSGLSIVSAIAEQFTQPAEIFSAPCDLDEPRKIFQPAHQQQQTIKATIRPPSNPFRLETTPILCFVSFTEPFN